MNNVTNISRGRELVSLNQHLESARITFLLAFVNPPKPSESIKDRVARVRAFLLTQFVDAGYSEDEAYGHVSRAHNDAYVEYLKV